MVVVCELLNQNAEKSSCSKISSHRKSCKSSGVKFVHIFAVSILTIDYEGLQNGGKQLEI